MEEKDYIQFEDYLQNTLSTDETVAFELRLKEDHDFQGAFETYKDLNGYLSHTFGTATERNAFKDNLQNISERHFSAQDTSTASTSETKVKTLRMKPLQYAIAASVMLLLGVTFFNQFSSPSYNDFSHDSISLTLRGDQDEQIKYAEEDFNAGNFAEAATLFEALRVNDSNNKEFALYHAISLIEIDQFNKAELILANLTATPSAYTNEAIWYQALGQLKQDNEEACILLLKQIPYGSDRYDDAQELIEDLD